MSASPLSGSLLNHFSALRDPAPTLACVVSSERIDSGSAASAVVRFGCMPIADVGCRKAKRGRRRALTLGLTAAIRSRWTWDDPCGRKISRLGSRRRARLHPGKKYRGFHSLMIATLMEGVIKSSGRADELCVRPPPLDLAPAPFGRCHINFPWTSLADAADSQAPVVMHFHSAIALRR
jgi:hypothetical protein